jgi:hypothetical protein
MRSNSGIVLGSRRPNPHPVAIENCAAYLQAVAGRVFVPATPVGVVGELSSTLFNKFRAPSLRRRMQ